MISGDYYFHDDLKYEFKDWNYCTGIFCNKKIKIECFTKNI